MAWHHEAPNQTAGKALVSLVVSVCRVCLVEPDNQIDQMNQTKPQMKGTTFLSILMSMEWVSNTFACESVANPGG